jgi:hypothetical protein
MMPFFDRMMARGIPPTGGQMLSTMGPGSGGAPAAPQRSVDPYMQQFDPSMQALFQQANPQPKPAGEVGNRMMTNMGPGSGGAPMAPPPGMGSQALSLFNNMGPGSGGAPGQGGKGQGLSSLAGRIDPRMVQGALSAKGGGQPGGQPGGQLTPYQQLMADRARGPIMSTMGPESLGARPQVMNPRPEAVRLPVMNTPTSAPNARELGYGIPTPSPQDLGRQLNGGATAGVARPTPAPVTPAPRTVTPPPRPVTPAVAPPPPPPVAAPVPPRGLFPGHSFRYGWDGQDNGR